MDDWRVGAAIRSVRRRRGLRQVDVARMADVSQGLISKIERGRLESVSIATVRQIGATLDIGLPFTPRWHGAELARLLDHEHAGLVEVLVSELRSTGWTVLVEYSFNYFGDRGSVDVVGWHEACAALLIAEVKSRILDSQDLHSVLDRKVRVVPMLLRRERGWHARVVGRLVFVAGTHANRLAVTRHAATFDTTLPQRSGDARRWLRQPSDGLAALWFVASIPGGRVRDGRGTGQRVRAAQHKAVGVGSRSS